MSAPTCPRCSRRQDEYRPDAPCWNCGWPETPNRPAVPVDGERTFAQIMREDWSVT